MSIVGTFAFMFLFGYSLDNLSLMALTLCVGFVVDDAIVMLENITRHMEMGEDRMTATASHIHMGAAGSNGPVIVPFTKSGDNAFSAAPDAKLTEEQFAAYKAGKLYVNVHSAKDPGGEIRGQLKGS